MYLSKATGIFMWALGDHEAALAGELPHQRTNPIACLHNPYPKSQTAQ